MYIQAKDAQLAACNNLIQRLEEKTVKLTAARYEAREMTRALQDCSDQLATTKQALNATEMKLNDTNEVPSRGKENAGDKTGKSAETASRSATTEDRSCSQQLTKARADLRSERLSLIHI